MATPKAMQNAHAKLAAAAELLASAARDAQDAVAECLFFDEMLRDGESRLTRNARSFADRINAAALIAHDAWMDSK